MGLVILVLLGLITAGFAYRKGFNPVIWFFAAGILGLLVLAFLPYVNEKSTLTLEQIAAKKKSGNFIGGVISGLSILFGLSRMLG